MLVYKDLISKVDMSLSCIFISFNLSTMLSEISIYEFLKCIDNNPRDVQGLSD